MRHLRAARRINATTLSDLNGTLGETPDPLIPTVDPYFHQTRLAFPAAAAAKSTRSAWIDVLVPPTAPPGVYVGKVTVMNGPTVITTLNPAIKVSGLRRRLRAAPPPSFSPAISA